jgi:cytosine/adenosine deaminase-related metal-dependent hydrolase
VLYGMAATSAWAAAPEIFAQAARPRRRLLVKGGYVLTFDRTLGDLDGGDVLIEGNAITAVGRNLRAGDAEVIDAASKIVLPGLVDSHRHTWQTALRAHMAQASGGYFDVVLNKMGPLYRPEDVYIGNLLGALGAINSGITTLLDWSHIMNSPEHADAAIQGLAESGIRAIFAHSDSLRNGYDEYWAPTSTLLHPADELKRIQTKYFNSSDQLLSLALGLRGPEFSSLEASIADIKLARELGVPISVHVGVGDLGQLRAVTRLNDARLLGPDITYIHTRTCTNEELEMIARSGGTISCSQSDAAQVERALRHGLKPSLSIDNETRPTPTHLFTIMRALLDVRQQAQGRQQPAAVPQMSSRDVLEYATVEGARATHLDSKVGTIAPGKRADLIVFNRDDIGLLPFRDDPPGTVVLFGEPALVSWVVVDGTVRKREGKLVDVNIEQIQRAAQRSRDYLVDMYNKTYS